MSTSLYYNSLELEMSRFVFTYFKYRNIVSLFFSEKSISRRACSNKREVINRTLVPRFDGA